MIQLSIIIPCYNEEGNLPALIEKCKAVVKINTDVEIILVNNGSTDNSKRVLDGLLGLKNNTNINVHHINVNQGYGYGILEGLKLASANTLCWTHADLQTDIFDCLKAHQIFYQQENPYLLVKGRRRGRFLLDTLFTFLMSCNVFYKLGKFIPDINAQPKLFSRKLYQKIVTDAPWDFSLDLYFLLHATKNKNITEFHVDFKQRTSGEAKGGSGNLKLKMTLAKRTINFINRFPKDQLKTNK